MLVFRTITPINSSATLQDLINISIKWINNSPNYDLKNTLDPYYGQNNFDIKISNEKFRCFNYTKNNTNYACLNFEKKSNEEKWLMELVYKKSTNEVLASFSIYFETVKFENRLNEIKKPYIIKLIDKEIGFGKDIQFDTNSEPYLLKHDDITLAESIINGDFIAHLPCVYISQDRYGEYPININTLSRNLSGMAHVFVEPNIYFAHDLRIKTDGRNPYHGAVGIFFPASTNKKILLPQWDNGNNLKIRTIFDTVKNALNFGYMQDDLSYSDLRASMLRDKISNIQCNNDTEAMLEYAFKENENLSETNKKQRDEITFLKERVKQLEESSSSSICQIINRGNMPDSYTGQVYDTIIDILETASKNTANGTRKKNIINELLRSNPKTDKKDTLISELKRILSGYTTMTNSIKSELYRLGFQVEKSGKHYKVFFIDYPEISSTLSASGSDWRGGANMLSDLKKNLL